MLRSGIGLPSPEAQTSGYRDEALRAVSRSRLRAGLVSVARGFEPRVERRRPSAMTFQIKSTHHPDAAGGSLELGSQGGCDAAFEESTVAATDTKSSVRWRRPIRDAVGHPPGFRRWPTWLRNNS